MGCLFCAVPSRKREGENVFGRSIVISGKSKTKSTLILSLSSYTKPLLKLLMPLFPFIWLAMYWDQMGFPFVFLVQWIKYFT